VKLPSPQNADFLVLAVRDPSLTEKGRAQARAIGEELSKRNPQHLIVSPMKRTRETAEEINTFLNLEQVTDEDWTEASFGRWDGMTPTEVEEQFPEEYSAWVADAWYRQGGGESYAATTERVASALRRVAAQYPSETVAIVTHNVVVKGAATVALSAPIDSIFHIDVAPCSITTIKIWPSDGLMALMSLSERAAI
jgi:probable phosphoglycerate mutase